MGIDKPIAEVLPLEPQQPSVKRPPTAEGA
jgi:hypothetical protein